MSAQPEWSIVSMAMDRTSSSMILTRSDGKEARFPLRKNPFGETSTLSQFTCFPGLNVLLATTKSGDDVAFEVPVLDGADQLDGRLAVYLDQNKWRVMANALAGIGDVSPQEDEAAWRLANWVRQRKIILPASAAQYAETTKWSDATKRYQLGLMILQLSLGWQMRDPLQVRRDEIRAAFDRRVGGNSGTSVGAVFSLAPNVIRGAARGVSPIPMPEGLPQEMAFQTVALTSATALIEVMLDTERVPAGSVTDWVEANQQFSDWLDGEKRDAQQKRKSIDAFLLNDIRLDLAVEAHAAQLTSEAVFEWMTKHAQHDLAAAPALGLLREMFHERHLNKGTIWRGNDLTDMIYLSCAAGYADFVVCERAMGNALRQGIKRLQRPVRVFRYLSDAAEAIETVLTTTGPGQQES
ncbi:hypothetical protein [Kitasatospora sp. NRRL B-11411]|uniref:hypothetical protein n=1 Tax=Kitasatospora sp. NRRL B-11411 TaxID=1463822 RepID=UPI0004C42A93|nr:hypothetical protein [Kitasatospora sp. NRRL B-11411]